MSLSARFTVVAGPNGVGKSTLIEDLRDHGFPLGPFINPDDIARTLEGSPASRDLRAGRETLHRTRARIAGSETFSRESTLTSREILRSMQSAKDAGFHVILLFVGVECLITSRDRVVARVARGGHDIPEDIQERRFDKSVENAVRATEVAHRSFFLDNTTESGHRLVGFAFNHHLVYVASRTPAWFTRIAEAISPWRRGVFAEIPTAFEHDHVSTLLDTIERLSRDIQDPAKRFAALRELSTLRREAGFT